MPRPPSLDRVTAPLCDAQAADAIKAILAGRLFQVLLLGHLTGRPAAGPQSS